MTFETAVTAVQSADTLEAMQAVLKQCTKVVIGDVYKAVTGQVPLFKKSMKKEELADAVAQSIIDWRADEAFKAKPFDEKYEILTTCSNSDKRKEYANLFTTEELQATVLRLGIPTRYDEDEEFDHWAHEILADDVIRELKVRGQVAKIEPLMNGDDAYALKKELHWIRPETLKRLLEKYGVSCAEDEMQEALYKYYLSSKQTRTQEETDPSPVEADADTGASEGMTREEYMNIVGRYQDFLKEASNMRMTLAQALDKLNEKPSLTDEEAEYLEWLQDTYKGLDGILD